MSHPVVMSLPVDLDLVLVIMFINSVDPEFINVKTS